jgi:sugar lactone lactonase YvrE
MTDLLKRADPATGESVDVNRLKAKVDERISAPTASSPRGHRRPWVFALAGFAAVMLVAIPILIRQEEPSVLDPELRELGDLAGFENVVPLASGGVQTMAFDGEAIWVLTSLQSALQRISPRTGRVEATYTIDRYVEGVVIGGGYVWLRSYDNGGEILRFDPRLGEVDEVIPVGIPCCTAGSWFADSLWVGNEHGQTVRISADGEILSTFEAEVKGQGLGHLWMNDPATGRVLSFGEDGTRGQLEIPTDGAVMPDGSGIREIDEAGGYLWLLEDDYPNGDTVTRFDPATGALQPMPITVGLLGMASYDGYLWVTSHTDHLLVRVDPDTGELTRFPMPGKAGGLLVADDSLWVTLYHPGVLVRLDTHAEMLEQGELVVDATENGHRLLCTSSGEVSGPTILLEPTDWVEYGSWSVIQAQLSDAGHLVCANGYIRGEASPAQRAADLDRALRSAEVPGPYVIVANGDGVHSARMFADGRDDVAGVVLVDPLPLGFGDFLDTLLSEADGHPPWLDLDPSVSSSLSGFGEAPLVVIGHDPDAVYLSKAFVDWAGEDKAKQINDYWQAGLALYASLSSNSELVVAHGTGLERILWNQPDLVTRQVLDVLGRAAADE